MATLDTSTLAQREDNLQATAVASAATVDLNTVVGDYVHITGTTTITALGTCSAGRRVTLVFDGALTFTHNATSLILPGAANITTAAGDSAVMVSEGSGNWRCTAYHVKANVPAQAGALSLAGTITGANATATTAGGSTTAGFKMGSGAFGIYFGSGAPTITAAKGSLYLRSDGSSTSTRLYVNTDGATTWTNVTTAA